MPAARRLLEAASRAVIEACPRDQKQWSLGMSAAARKAVAFAIKELERCVQMFST